MSDISVYKDYEKWKNWGENFGELTFNQKRYYDKELNKIEKYLQKKELKVLEIGFGNGEFLSYGKKKGWNVYGIEINEELVAIGLEHGFNVFSSLDDLAESSFDLIVAFDVLEHIPACEITGFVLNIKEILCKNGFFIARFPNADSPIGLKYQNGDLTHLNAIGSNKVEQLAKNCEMDIFFMGGQAEILIQSSIATTLFSFFVYPIKKTINIFFKFIYFPTSPYYFSSKNLVFIFRKSIS